MIQPSNTGKLSVGPGNSLETLNNFNFDIQSRSSTYVFDENKMQKFEEDIQQKIQEIWQQIEAKQEQLQAQYQEELETIIEEVT